MQAQITKLNPLGINKDISAYELPDDKWSDGNNIQFDNERTSKIEGYRQVYGTPSAAPYWLLRFNTITKDYWIYPSLTSIHRVHTAGTVTTHEDVTRTSGAYSATAEGGWNGGVLGGVAIVNNGIDVPQMLGTSATDFADLTNWTSGHTAKVVRPFKRFLVALDKTEAGTRYPFRVHWSHPAEGGTVPVTWNSADDTKDAGYVDLSQTNGFVVDSFPLGDSNIVYKSDSVWSMTYEGGQSIFGFRQIFSDTGILGRNCVKGYDKKHFVVADDDVYIHDGNTKQSVVDGQIRDELFNAIHPDYKSRTFVTVDRENNEMLVCFVSNNNSTDAFADVAYVWNWRNNTWTKRDLPHISYIEWDVVDTVSTTDWSETGDWDTDNDSWNSPPKSNLLVADATNTQLYVPGSTQFDGTNFRAWVEKSDMLLGYGEVKSVSKIKPRITGTGSVNFYVGSEMLPHQGMTWKGPYAFTSGVHSEIAVRATGTYIGVRVESEDDKTWRLENLEIHWTPAGTRGSGV